MKTYNSYQQAHYSALYGATKKEKRYGLYEGAHLIMEQPKEGYGLLVWKRNEMIRNGSRKEFLKIKLKLGL